MRISINTVLVIFTVVCFGLGGYFLWAGHKERNPARSAPYQEGSPIFRLSDRISTLHVEKTSDGHQFVFETDGGDVALSPEEFAAQFDLLEEKREKGGVLFRVLDITSTSGVVWVALGFLGQLLFTGRMVVQWLASERAKESIVPPSFWWMSLFGSSMLIIYFWWRIDVVGVLGQATGWVVYIRNILLLKKVREAKKATS